MDFKTRQSTILDAKAGVEECGAQGLLLKSAYLSLFQLSLKAVASWALLV